MSSPTSNFSHLTDIDALLARFGAQAEQYFLDDPNTALFKTRQFAERFASVVANRSGTELVRGESLSDVLRKLQLSGAAPREILDVLHTLRKEGNSAVHDFQGERRGAFDALKLCHRLAVWLRATITNQPGLTIKFAPPASRKDDSEELKQRIAELEDDLSAAERAFGDEVRKTAEAHAARTAAEDRAVLAYEERLLMEQLALEAESKTAAASKPTIEQSLNFVKSATEAARNLNLDEDDTRIVIDEQLRAAEWEIDSAALRYSQGTRPERNRNMAIAEWPTANGPADYALFVGEKLVGLVEAKRKNKEVASFIDQAERYASGTRWEDGMSPAGGPWGAFKVPFVFSSNGRGYFPQLRTQSGIWFRDVRRPTNGARPLEGWPTPAGLMEQLEVDVDAAEASLTGRAFDFEFALRPYQMEAIKAVEAKIAEGQRDMLVAMATGTGKTKLSIALIYRLLEAKRFNRVCFVVDRSALGEQAEQAFDTTKMVGARTFAEIFGLKGLSDKEIDRDVKVHVCTVQGLVNRVLARTPDERPPVDQYDFIMVDECHRGYLLDKEMSAAEMTFRSEEDYVSKYRRALEYFDAVKVGLTATPALHTAQIFGQPIYRYGYRDAVIDGWLVDHDPPHNITTALSAAGISFEAGETIEVFNTETGQIDTATLEDKLDFQVEQFNRRVRAPAFNRVVAEEIAARVDILDPNGGKTLVFATSDDHASEVVDALKVAYRAQGDQIDEGMIRKITGSIDRPGDAIKKFKNENDPRIVVTVDLLTTGIDVPRITNLVFMRRVNSRILYDQMIGRATRLCEEIGKTSFQIYDAVDLYRTLQPTSEMKPVVVNPSVTFDELFKGLAQAEDEAHQKEITEQIIVKLRQKVKRLHEEARRQYEAQTGETPEATLQRLRNGPPAQVREWAADKPGIGQFFDFRGERNAPPIVPIYSGDDTLVGVSRGYGAGEKPEDFISSFAAFVRDNQNRIAALNTVLTSPRDLTRESLRDLRRALDANYFSDANVRAAWKDAHNEDIAASIVGFIRQAALGEALVPYAERVDRAIRKVAKERALNDKQRRWLERIGGEMKSRIVVDRAALDDAPFAQQGGFKRIDKDFGGEAEEILRAIADATWSQAA